MTHEKFLIGLYKTRNLAIEAIQRRLELRTKNGIEPHVKIPSVNSLTEAMANNVYTAKERCGYYKVCEMVLGRDSDDYEHTE